MPIVLCSYCALPTTLPDPWPHAGFVCPHCRTPITLAAPATSTPHNVFSIDAEPSAVRVRSQTSQLGSIGQANQIMACIGAALLLIGMFLPMLNTPIGVSMSFVDLPWKLLTIGIQGMKDNGDGMNQLEEPKPRPEKKETNEEKKLIKIVGMIAIMYPIVLLVIVAMTFWQVSFGSACASFVVLGGLSLLATALYGLALVALNKNADFRLVFAALSPGLGWAVLAIGGLILTSSGVIQSEARDRYTH